jgi:hypothetical protein
MDLGKKIIHKQTGAKILKILDLKREGENTRVSCSKGGSEVTPPIGDGELGQKQVSTFHSNTNWFKSK